jgi:hypothetical protein
LTFKKSWLLGLLLLSLAPAATASDHLLYFEAQGIIGYSSQQDKAIYYSMNPDAEMQKPSLGFDYIQRFSGETGDWATFALQARLALTVDSEKEEKKLEGQIYNAYFRVRTPGPYVWVGHNRPAFGLSSYFDSHGLILRTLAIQGFGYDRDWGFGIQKDFSWGDVLASLTTGSGMPVYFNGNYMAAGRISFGVLSRDNITLGFSLGYGNTLDTMGYDLRDPEPRQMSLGAMDLTLLRDYFEHRFDLYAGQWLGQETYALFYRFGVNLDQEGRLKIEAQPTYWKFGNEENFQMNVCVSALATSDLTVRLGYTYDNLNSDHRFILQLYYYRPVSWLSSLTEKIKSAAKE